jgi:hypothetical protein
MSINELNDALSALAVGDKSDESNKAAISDKSVNKGTGAGGSNTNLLGKSFELRTLNPNLSTYKKYVYGRQKRKHDFHMVAEGDDMRIVFAMQSGFKQYVKNKYNISIFRLPDEAYILEYKSGRKVVKILEKKEQSGAGSVETKLWAGPSLKREFEIVMPGFEIVYGFCVSSYLQKLFESQDKKYVILNKILAENGIEVLFGESADYSEKLNIWVNN